MIYRIFATKDTFITNQKRANVPQTASNFGASEILNLHVIAPTSSTLGISSGSSARILTKFEVGEIAALTASRKAPTTGLSYRLRLKNAPHAQTLPSSFDVEVLPLSRDWDEGSGLDNDDFSDRGYANWDRAKSNVFWTNPGGDVVASPYSVAHFDRGDEDLSLDVTSIVQAWLTGGLANNGFMIRMSSSLESGSLDYYVKMFHARNTNFGDRRPYLEASWDDSVRDDRNNFCFDVTGSLFLYNEIRGQLTDITGIGTGSVFLRIVDASGTLMTLTGSHMGQTGMYSCSFVLPTGSYSGSAFRDIWFSGGLSYMTGNFYPSDSFASVTIGSSPLFVNVSNLKNQYEQDETVRLRLFVRDRDYNPAVVLTASSAPTGKVLTRVWYRIENDRTSEVVVPFGTGSVETTRLSYDKNGNYFKFYMRSLPPGNVYRLVFLASLDGEDQIIDNDFKFRIT